MNISVRAEARFHDQNMASVSLENSATGDDARLAELMLFVFYTVRSLANLRGSPVADSLGQALLEAGQDPEGFAVAFDDDIRVIDNVGRPVSKRFVATLRARNDRVKFHLKAKGFGPMGQGLQYYSPSSVLVLLAKLVKRHSQDATLTRIFGDAAMGCGQAQQHGVISVASQNQIALAILDELMS